MYTDRGRVHVEAGDEQNYPSERAWRFSCYSFDSRDMDLVFPFHWPCYELLARALAGTDDVEAAIKQVDNDLLYVTMQRILRIYPKCLNLNYGVNSKAQEQWWRCILGYEFVVAPFDNTTTANSILLRATISSNSFQLPAVERNLGPKVEKDPFQKLPYEIV